MKINLLKLDFLGELRSSFSRVRQIETAKDRFKTKNAFDSLYTFLPLSNIGRFFLPVLSIITGMFSLLYILDSFMNIWLASFLCFTLLGLWEKTKSLVLVRAFERFYKGYSSSVLGIFVFAILFSLGSIYLSVNGTWELSQRFDDTEINIDVSYGHKKDSLERYYHTKIANAKMDAKSYFEKNSYKGVITFSKDGRYADHYRKLQERVMELEVKKEMASDKLLSEKVQSLKSDKVSYQRFVYSFLAITFLIELLIILSNWFPVYFDYKIYEESEIINQQINRGYTNISLDDLKDVINNIIPYQSGFIQHNQSNSNEKNSIGFNLNSKENNDNALRDAIHKHNNEECEHCGKAFVKRTTWQKYCSQKCRTEAWELKTGKDFFIKNKVK